MTETVVITGANRGIGLALAQRFARAGWRVIAGSRSPEGAAALRALSFGEQLQIVELDVADPESVTRFCLGVGDRLIDVLINNAGVKGGGSQGLDRMDFEEWRYTFDVNTMAPFRLTQALLPNLRRSKNPRVVTLSSQMGALNRTSSGSYAYRSSKAAVNKVMQTLATDLAREHIIVCPVHPGWVQTDMGGSGADLSAEQSANGLFQLVNSLTLEHSGRFWTWQGNEHPW